MELSGATTANWVAKSANLLVDSLGVTPGDRVGLLLPLHWQSVALLLAGVAAGAQVVVATEPAGLAGCVAAFTTADAASAALDAGVDEVLALSCHPLGVRLTALPPLVQDYAIEVPGHGDHWGGPTAAAWAVEVTGAPLVLPVVSLGPADRVLAGVPMAEIGWLLAALAAGASAVLVPDPVASDLVAVAAAERVTATAGTDVPGLPRLDPASDTAVGTP